MPRLCSSLSHQSFSSCRKWRRCLKPVWNYSSAKHGEGTPVGPWPPCCPQWSLHVRFLLAAVTVGQLLRCFYSGYSRTVGRLNCLCPVSARTCLKVLGWAFAVPSSWVFQEPGSAEHGFRSRCKPRAHRKVQREVNLGAAVVCLAIIKTFSCVRQQSVLDWQSESHHWAKLQSGI